MYNIQLFLYMYIPRMNQDGLSPPIDHDGDTLSNSSDSMHNSDVSSVLDITTSPRNSPTGCGIALRRNEDEEPSEQRAHKSR